MKASPRKIALIAVATVLHVLGFVVLMYSFMAKSNAFLVLGVAMMAVGTPSLYWQVYGHHYANIQTRDDLLRHWKWMFGDRRGDK